METKHTEGDAAAWNSFNEICQKRAEKHAEATKNLTTSLMDTYHKQMQLTMESTKKIQDEFTKHAQDMFKLNQQFWADMLNASHYTMGSFTDYAYRNANGNGMAHDIKKHAKVHN